MRKTILRYYGLSETCGHLDSYVGVSQLSRKYKGWDSQLYMHTESSKCKVVRNIYILARIKTLWKL